MAESGSSRQGRSSSRRNWMLRAVLGWGGARPGNPTVSLGRSASLAIARLARALARPLLLALAGSLFVALCSRVALPLPFSPVPVTGQTFGVLVVGGLLGRRLGAAALLAYLIEGAAGLPVFSPGPTWGVARLLSPTGGYLVGFVGAAWVVGWLADAGRHRRVQSALLSMALGTASIYAAGVMGLLLYFPIERALALGLYPFLLGDALKAAAAALVVAGQRPLAGPQALADEPPGESL